MSKRRNKYRDEPISNEAIMYSDRRIDVIAKNQHQADYIHSIERNIITFGIGSAGVGKSYLALAYAAKQLVDKKIKKVFITRPLVDCDEELGFLPGDLKEKLQPYVMPIKDNLCKLLGSGFTDYLFNNNVIEIRPLAYMRGSTFDNCIVILDEAQNTTKSQMKMFLTRIGDRCKVIVDGDIEQCDLPNGVNGLKDAVNRLGRLNNVGIVNFTVDDIVRSGIVKDILKAYRD